MSFMNKYDGDSIYEEMEGKSRGHNGSGIASKITASVLLFCKKVSLFFINADEIQ